MKQWKRLLFYIILNILVSACTILVVLMVWDQFYGSLPRGLLPKALLNPDSKTGTPVTNLLLDTPIPGPTPTEEFIVYQVQSGDTFDSIAEQFNMSVEELRSVNGFSKVQPLGEGEILLVPMHPKGMVIIASVIGAGDLASERVLLKHRGEGELSLMGWSLDDGKGNIFVFPQFPQLTLFGGGAVNIYTKAGTNTVVDLYWGLDHAIWLPGTTVTLSDEQGNPHASYVIP